MFVLNLLHIVFSLENFSLTEFFIKLVYCFFFKEWKNNRYINHRFVPDYPMIKKSPGVL
jgi:hypothetical protein